MTDCRTPHVIAEIGCNHRGDVDTAKDLIMMAAQFCKVDVVKFQKRTPRECLTEQEFNTPHPNPAMSYGDTYGQHREFLEFDIDTHRELKAVAESFGVAYSSSVWDLTSAREVMALAPALIKVPSACNTWFELLELLVKDFDGDIHISSGMTTHDEEKQIVEFFVQQNAANRVVLYHCTSGYPVPFENLNLLDITRLIDDYGDTVKAIGYSGHHLGIAADTAAFTLGAEWVERHFTLDRTWKGTDHAASLEPDGMRRVVRDLKAISKALTMPEKEVLDIEAVQRKKLKWNRQQLA